MALFKEIHCAQCGKKTGILTRTRLADDQYVCTQCTGKIPRYIKQFLPQYSYENFKAMTQYLTQTNRELRQIFTLTHSYKGINLDSNHGIFYVGDLGTPLYLLLSELESFELQFVVEDAKEGLLADKVVGEVRLSMQVGFPAFCRDEVLATRVKAIADVKEGLFKKTFRHGNPKGMDAFMQEFKTVWAKAREEKYMQRAVEQVRREYMG